MKNQYFGDNRDLFKYDLIIEIVQSGLVNHFTFIPMLTEHDATEQGGTRNRHKAKAGKNNCSLVKFLDGSKEKDSRDSRDIKKLKGFFQKQNIKMTLNEKYFCHNEREKYFAEQEKKLLPNSLIFIDPDIGLEIKRTRGKHIKYCEVKNLYECMCKSSILMVYQHFPRIRTQNNIQEYFCQRAEKLKEITGDLPIYIDDNEIRFFFLTKAKSTRNSLVKVLGDYKKIYPKLTT